MGCLPPVFQCEGWFWGLRESVLWGNSSWGRAIQQRLGKGRWPRSNPGPAPPFPGIWGLVVVGGWCFSCWFTQRVWALDWMLLLENWGWVGSGWVDTPSVSSFLPWSREKPAHQGPTLQKQDAEPVGFQGFLPAKIPRNFNWIANRRPWYKRRNLPMETLWVLRLQTHRDLRTNKAWVTPNAIYFLQYI